MAAEKNFENRVKRFMFDIDAWGFKYPATGPMCVSGIPDLNYCVAGRWVSMEVKAQDGRPSQLQIKKCESIRKAGGLSVILYPSGWERFLSILLSITRGDEVIYEDIEIIQK